MKRKAAKKAARKPSTGLVVRPKAKAPVVRINDPKGLLPALQAAVGQLGEVATVGALGLAELKLTPEEDAILGEAVNPADVMMKPKVKGGPAEIPYLPHIVYTRWFHRAFGRTGWAVVPTSAPKKVDNLILVTYLLYVHGVPVASATGEQEYYESNKQQTYGDVIESTVASALRRFAKRLGVGLELWDKRWLDQHFGKRGGQPRQQHGGDTWTEAQINERHEDDRPVIDVEASSQLEPITVKQWERIAEISKRAGRDDAEVKLWLKKSYGVKNLKDIPRTHYAAICQQLEARGALPMPGDGQ